MMEFIFFFVAMESSNPNEQTQGHDAREYELDKLEAGELKYYGDTTKELNEVPAAHYLLDNHIEVGVSKQKRDSAKGVIEAGGLNKKAVFTS
nr:probable ubiquitin-conjugating enzyme E2 37 [Ipomoea batatas]